MVESLKYGIGKAMVFSNERRIYQEGCDRHGRRNIT